MSLLARLPAPSSSGGAGGGRAQPTKPYSLSDESDLDTDDDNDDKKSKEEEGEEEVGDDVIRRPIVKKDMSPFEEYVAEKKASGITLARKSGRYDDEDVDDDNGHRAGGAKSKSYGGMLLGGLPFVLVAHERGARSDHVQCTIFRDRSTVQTKLYPEYQLVLDDSKKPLLLARKMSMNMTSNYHIFDLTRGVVGSKLTKKSGNYLGKVRALNASRTEYVIVSSSKEREECGGVVFERLTLLDQLKAGSQPRKMVALVPALGDSSIAEPNRPARGDTSIALMLKKPLLGNAQGMFVLETKAPHFENGNYRLNFKGRVSLPSVKNFQLVSPNDTSDVVLQFGKVNDDKFHLDFKAPLNAFQAFSLAITQFNL